MACPKRLLDAVLAEQRRDWIAGKRIPADETLRQHPELADEPACAAELIYHEFSLRQELGESPDWQQQLRQYPEHAALLERLRQADQLVEQTLAAPRNCPRALLPTMICSKKWDAAAWASSSRPGIRVSTASWP